MADTMSIGCGAEESPRQPAHLRIGQTAERLHARLPRSIGRSITAVLMLGAVGGMSGCASSGATPTHSSSTAVGASGLSAAPGLASSKPAATSVPPGMLPPPPPSPSGEVTRSIEASNRAGQAVKAFGKPAGPAEHAAVASAVQSYLAMISSGNYSGACTLLSSASHRFLTLRASHPGLLYHKSCEEAIALMYKLGIFRGVRARLGQLVVSEVRVRGNHGFALLSDEAPRKAEAYVPISRDSDSWRLDSATPLALQISKTN